MYTLSWHSHTSPSRTFSFAEPSPSLVTADSSFLHHGVSIVDILLSPSRHQVTYVVAKLLASHWTWVRSTTRASSTCPFQTFRGSLQMLLKTAFTVEVSICIRIFKRLETSGHLKAARCLSGSSMRAAVALDPNFPLAKCSARS